MAGGVKLSRTHSQGDVTGKQFNYDVDAAHATLLAPGDVMRITGTASTDGTPQIDASAASVQITGVLFSVNPIFSGEALSETGLPVGTGGSVLVDVDPNALYDVAVSNGVLAVGDVGQNINLAPAAATTSGGLSISNMTVDAGTNAVDPTLPFSIVAILPSEAIPAVFGDRALVRVNASTVLPGASGV
jgi:hypothetical protein